MGTREWPSCSAGVTRAIGAIHKASPRRVSRLHQGGVSRVPRRPGRFSAYPFLVWSPPPIAGTMEPVCHLITRRPRPPRSASNNPPVANSNPTSNSRNTSQCNNTSPPRCWGGKVSRAALALTPSSSRSSAPLPPTVSRPPGLGSGAAHRPARPLSSSSSASSPGSSSSSSASSPRNGPHPWPLSEFRDTGPAPSA